MHKEFYNKLVGLRFEYPVDWELKQEDNVLSLYNLYDGVGAMQFSAFKIPEVNNIKLSEELSKYLIEKGYKDFKIGIFENYVYSDLKQGKTNWEYWMVLINNHIIFITYNCLFEDSGKEKEDVKSIVDSLLSNFYK